jgi:hypothetical protein
MIRSSGIAHGFADPTRGPCGQLRGGLLTICRSRPSVTFGFGVEADEAVI